MKDKKTWDFWLLFFFFISFIGWLWEVALYLFLDGSFINRGFLMGPLLPVYGTGALLFSFCFSRFSRRPALLFVLCSLSGTLLEYLCSLFTEKLWGVRFWDYSSFPLQFQGRICLWCSLLFGVGGLLLFYVLLPAFTRLFEKISPGVRFLLCLVLCFFAAFDLVFSLSLPQWGRDVAYAVWLQFLSPTSTH